MKKSTLLILATIALISCGNTYKAHKVVLEDLNDSVNYALGFLNGGQLKAMYFQEDSSEAVINEFMDALNRGYNNEIKERSEIAAAGYNIGSSIKASEKSGLADNKAWALNEKIFFQALVNGMHGDTTGLKVDEARAYFMNAYQQSAQASETEAAGVIKKSKCPKAVAAVALNSENDSLNYAFGLLNGDQVRQYLLRNDSTGEQEEEFIAAINEGLHSHVINPQLVNMGEQIGKSIREQEPQGLLGEASLMTDFALISQGFVNGLYGFNEPFDMQSANSYITETMNHIRYGNVKEQGEQFLAENALRDGVTVTESGLQYEVIKMGKGPKPAADSKVKVHYHGTLIDGTVFDSSVDRGEPITFGLNQVIKGWTEGVQLMPVGSKFRFYIPQELGYGAQSAGKIPPYSTLIFDVELLGIE